MNDQNPSSRRRFLQSVLRLLGLASVTPARQVFAQAPNARSDVGAHLAVVKVRDGAGKVWSAQAHVGDDPKMPAAYVMLVDKAGNEHPGLTAWFYADGVDVGACRFDNAYDYIHCRIDVVYDGAPIAVPPSSKADGTVDFWRGCRMPTIRYGVQAPVPSLDDVDWSVLPSYARQAQAPYNDTYADYTFNGKGLATTPGMGQGGERPDIGYMSQWNMGFLCNGGKADWYIVRQADDWAGVWPIYYCDPQTGTIIDRRVQTHANFLPVTQQQYKDNPVVPYAGSHDGNKLIPPSSPWKTTACPNVPNGAHLTSYGLLTAMLTGTARDLDHASFWSNYPLMEVGPAYTEKSGVMHGAQRRIAWCLRNIFFASFYSADTEYFSSELNRNLTIANIMPKNPFGIVATLFGYRGKGAARGFKGMSPWMQAYLAMVMDAVAFKQPEWKPFARFVCSLFLQWHEKPYTPLATLYNLMAVDSAGILLASFDEMVRLSCIQQGWSDTDAQAAVSATTVQQVYDLMVKNFGNRWSGLIINGVSDYAQYINSPDGYPAGHYAAVIAALNLSLPKAEAAIKYDDLVPTKPDYTKNQKYHFKPRVINVHRKT